MNPESGSSSASHKPPSLRPGMIIYDVDPSTGETQQFTCGRLLGEGGFAKCVEVTDGVHSYALKAVNRASLQKPKNLEKLHSEIAIHRRMKHKHIVNFIRSFKDKHYVYMLLEKCDCGTVKDLIKARPLNVEEAQYVMLQCLSATQYMHKNNVIHRDLKPGNIMLDSSLNVKIGDFGLATEMQFDGERKRTVCGTPNYMAPEIIDRSSKGHSFEVDTWSLGVILYTMLVGEPPFQMEDVQSTYRRIRQGLYEFPGHVSESAQDLIRCMLSTSPSSRPTLIDIRTHAFFASPPPPMITPVSLLAIARRYRHRSTSRRVTTATPQQAQPASSTKDASPPPVVPLAVRDENQTPPPHREAVAHSKNMDSLSPPPTSPHHGTAVSKVSALHEGRQPSGPYVKNGGEDGHVYGGGVPSTTPPGTLSGGSVSGRRRHTTETGTAFRTSSPHLHLQSPPQRAASSEAPLGTGEGRPSPSLVPRRSVSAAAPTGSERPTSSVPRGPSTVSLVRPTLWVQRCVDFTRKYGFCYLLSNKVVGAMFNDVTKLFWDLDSDQVVYIIRVQQPGPGAGRGHDEDGEEAPKRYSTDSPTWFPMNEYPEALKKKITLIKYFRTFLTEPSYQKRDTIVQCSSFNGSSAGAGATRDIPPPGDEDWVYVKGWAKVEDAHIFRLSNKSVQVCFADGSEMFFFWQLELATYRHPGSEREPPVQRTVPIREVRDESKLSVGLRYMRSAYRHHNMF